MLVHSQPLTTLPSSTPFPATMAAVLYSMVLSPPPPPLLLSLTPSPWEEGSSFDWETPAASKEVGRSLSPSLASTSAL